MNILETVALLIFPDLKQLTIVMARSVFVIHIGLPVKIPHCHGHAHRHIVKLRQNLNLLLALTPDIAIK